MKSESYKPCSCGGDCFALDNKDEEPCWGQVEAIAEEVVGDDWWWIHGCQGHYATYYPDDGKYEKES